MISIKHDVRFRGRELGLVGEYDDIQCLLRKIRERFVEDSIILDSVNEQAVKNLREK